MRLPVQCLLLAILATATIVTTAPAIANPREPTPTRVPAVVPHEPTTLEIALFELANQDRIRAGLPTLEFDFEALAIARARAAAQPSDGSLTHVDANGNLVFADLLNTLGIEYHLAGENLARIPGPASVAPNRAEVSLMNSPTHRANILEPTFTMLAVGSTIDGHGRTVFAQVFRARKPLNG
jgi:uncharacterized protein YkwD